MNVNVNGSLGRFSLLIANKDWKATIQISGSVPSRMARSQEFNLKLTKLRIMLSMDLRVVFGGEMDQQQTDNVTTDVTGVSTGIAEGHLRVRLFSSQDVGRAEILVQQHHASTLFRHQNMSKIKLDQHIKQILSRPPNMVGISAEWNGDVIGLAWATSSEYLLTDESCIVSINLIAVDLSLRPLRRAKIFLALISAIRHWATSKKAAQVFLHVTTGHRLKQTDRLVRACGGTCIGGSYVI
ncbi:hypothetical protein [Agrobacterium pusense]|uniref:hypothetical protein n=1 Tax=Agrobacterium pusense TaxID=648995 RepID=UPI0024531311|nr:hypothetical protein [Agrobacterium pusense]